MTKNNCRWDGIFDAKEADSLNYGLFYTGVWGMVFSLWPCVTIVLSDLWKNRSYSHLTTSLFAQIVRRFFWASHWVNVKMGHDSVGSMVLTLGLGGAVFELSHEFRALVNTFVDIYEIETLTHLCIERYVIAKYQRHGWAVTEKHYSLFLHLCIGFSLFYSIMPFFGLGRYGFDFTCDIYTFDMVLPNTWQDYLVLGIFVLRSIKPCMFMQFMLVMVYVQEETYAKENRKQLAITKTVTAITLMYLVCAAPIFLIRGHIIISQLVTNDVVLPSAFSVKWALWIQMFTPVVTTMTMLVVDKKLRLRMLYQETYVAGENKQPLEESPEKKEE